MEPSDESWREKVKGKTWDQLDAEREAESDAKAAELMTPEYVKDWEDAEAEEAESEEESESNGEAEE